MMTSTTEMNSAVSLDVRSLLDSWIEAEKNGDRFPVPFEQAFPMAGYKHKRTAKTKLPKRLLGAFYAVSPQKSGERGRPIEVISLSIDGLKHLCLMADTEEGDAIRQYFIECEKKWQKVQKIAPKVAAQAEEEADPILASLRQAAETRLRKIEHEKILKRHDEELEELRAYKAAQEKKEFEATERLRALPPASNNVPDESLRMKIRRVINDY